ncbi:variant erythrocyte surface antigen [Babesia gibsoni]|uniref:Variant erythrocyte surface antigen n=1 Tax=Babesia gibsoni TaxID=33632 RepID=A0AAD8LND1_BABGI|nr:variant erythrocyte surface antigen [Babesia gibsoni]
MVAYGVPVIHQSLATTPLDIKEAIDWLIRIGGKDVKDEGMYSRVSMRSGFSAKDKTGGLINVLRTICQTECKEPGAVNAISEASPSLTSLSAQLARFVGYGAQRHSSDGLREVDGSGIGRRSGHAILNDIYTGGYLMCCKGDSKKCGPNCQCCKSGGAGSLQCNPQSCPIKELLDCYITPTVMCGGDYAPKSRPGTKYRLCCVLSFLVTCLVEGEELNNSSVKCRRCGQSDLHADCHEGCMCVHKKAVSKVACRINCIIQLARTLRDVYVNKGNTICQTCMKCMSCNPPNQSNRCRPCTKCRDGEHCDNCMRGECCNENQINNHQCRNECRNCQTCAPVRNATAFWDALDNLLYRCMQCRQCTDIINQEHKERCTTCTACFGGSCSEACKKRKQFGTLVLDLLYFAVYNFGDVSYGLTWRIAAIKEECCRANEEPPLCNCKETCCGQCEKGGDQCVECDLYCVCCVDGNDKASCNCANQCSEKLELLLRPALSGYVSAYDYKTATWEELCRKENGKPRKCSEECTAECQCYSATCPEEGCCAHCPKRQCAKTFCLIVPAIQSFLNYVKKHITDELREGNGNPASQWAGALISGGTQLGEVFRTCGFAYNRLLPRVGCDLMKHNVDVSNEFCKLRDHNPGNLKDILESLEKYNASICNALHVSHILSAMTLQCRKPETVREKLLWLCGLPYSDAYEELQQRFKDSMPNGSSSQHIMELTLRLTVFPFHILENSSQSVWHYVTQGCQVPNTKHSLYYNPDPTRLLWDLYDAMYDLTCALTFLNKQCGVSIQNCGWEECKFGKSVNLNGSSIDVCNCQMGKCNPTCYHCTDVCNACRGDAKCVCCCPHCEQRPDSCVCLVRFITSHGTLPDQEVVSRFSNARYGNMAFPRDSLRNMEMAGALLYDCMSSLLTRDHALYPRLLEDLLVARAGIPWNLSDYYALFLSLGRKLELESNQKGAPGKALTEVFKSTMRDTFFGAHEGNLEHVVIAVRHLYNQDQAMPAASSVHKNDFIHQASDIMSVNGCYHGKGCVGYMYALSSGMYERDSEHPYKGVSDSTQMFTKWIFFGATAFYNAMKHLTAEINTLECCNSSCYCRCNPGDSNTCVCSRCKCFCQEADGNCSCGTIIKCNNIHPLLYRYGFTLHEPDIWSYPKRRCQDFSDTLNRFIGPDSMLCRLIEAIENFLWHIRMPFCIALLTLWATALCFLMYVFIGHLDRLGIRSRWVLRTPIAHPLQFVMNTKVKPMGSGVGVI